MEAYQKDFSLQKMSTEQSEAKNKRIEQELERVKKESAQTLVEFESLRGDFERISHERDEFSTSYMNALQLLDETNQAAGRRGPPAHPQGAMRPPVPAPKPAYPSSPQAAAAAGPRAQQPLYPQMGGNILLPLNACIPEI